MEFHSQTNGKWKFYRRHLGFMPGQLSRAIALTFMTILLVAGPARLGAQVLIVDASSYETDVQAKLAASPYVNGPVDVFNAQSGTPTLSQLQQYKAVFVFSDSTFSDPTALGNVLADYADGGGGVVQAVFATFSSYSLSGRWESGGYDPVSLGTYGSSSMTFDASVPADVSVPGSPLLAGVATLNNGTGNFYAGGITLRAGATLIASWGDGTPLVVTNSTFGNRIVVLNFYPPSSDIRSDFWLSSTDGTRLMANAINFVSVPEPSTYALLAGGAAWLAWVRRRRAA